jgi:hypothetical protein
VRVVQLDEMTRKCPTRKLGVEKASLEPKVLTFVVQPDDVGACMDILAVLTSSMRIVDRSELYLFNP